GCSGWRVRLDGNRPRTHPSPKPRRKPARKPSASKSGPRGRDLHNPLTDLTGASRLSAPSPLPPKSHSERRTANRTPTSPYDFSPGKEHRVCIWKSDVQVLTVLAANRTWSPGVCPRGSAITIRLLR